MNRKAILVIGMHRSGTSAISGEIVGRGASPPKTPLPANLDNPKGYCEPRPLVQFHDQLLARIGASWDSWDPQIAERLQEAFTDQDARTLREIIDAEFHDAELPLIKDPRLCLFLPIWLSQAPALGLTLCPVLAFRNPLEVALSLQKRNGFPLDASALIWLCHNLLAEQWTRTIPRCVFALDQFLAQPRAALDTISRRFSLTLTPPADAARPFIERDLIHHREQDFSKLSSAAISVLSQLTHAALQGVVDRESPAQFALLDALSESFGRHLRLNRRFRRATWSVHNVKQTPLPGAIRGSNIEIPRHGTTVGGPVLEIRGWVLAQTPYAVEAIEVLEDGASISSTTALSARPDVAAAFPAMPAAIQSGIRLHAPLPREERIAELEIRASLSPQEAPRKMATLARITINPVTPHHRSVRRQTVLNTASQTGADQGPDARRIKAVSDEACALSDLGRSDLSLRLLFGQIDQEPAWLSARCDAAIYLMSIRQFERAGKTISDLLAVGATTDIGRYHASYTVIQLLINARLLTRRVLKRVRRQLARWIRMRAI